MRLALLFFAFLHLVPLAGAAERLRIVKERGMPSPGDRSPSQTVVIDLTGRTEAERNLIAQLWAKYAAAFPPEHRTFAVPDAGGTRIELEHSGQALDVFSCHADFERNANLVVTSEGVEALSGRSRAEVLREQPAWFQQFRAAFDAILAAAHAFPPPG